MTAIDTNVLARVIVNDDPPQAVRAAAFLRVQPSVLIPTTVLLELEWVLRGAYRLPRETISGSIRRILTLSNVEVEDEPTITLALQWYEQGLDFADSLHLASKGRDRSFATFDRALRKRAGRLGIARFADL